MSVITRYIAGAPIAAGLTLGLGVIMAGLIHHDGPNVQEKASITIAPINVVPDDIFVKRKRDLPHLTKVDIPPAPPIIDRATPGLPSEPIAHMPGDGAFILPPIKISTNHKIVPIDGGAEPIVRIPPVMPTRAQRSGHCNMRFDVSAEGSPFNVTAVNCSQNLFERASIKSVQGWKYKPRIHNGQAIAMRGLTTRISFNLNDERGNVIPE